MKAVSIVALLFFAASSIQALNMDMYDPQDNVEPELTPWLKRFYEGLESPIANETYTDSYDPEGVAVMGRRGDFWHISTGPGQILAQKQTYLPEPSDTAWSHIIHGFFLYEDAPKLKTYAGLVTLQTTAGKPPGTCTETYGYIFLSFHAMNGTVNLEPGGGGLAKYNASESMFVTGPTIFLCLQQL